MKSLMPLLATLYFATTTGFGQGLVDFLNTPSTLISVGGTAMPGANSEQFIFALFLAPSDTVVTDGQTVSFDDPRFQWVAAYNTNHPTAVGRLVNYRNATVSGASTPGETVDFIVRGWSANAGATWVEALSNYRVGFTMFLGSSTVGNDLVLGGAAIPTQPLFGLVSPQVGGFNMASPCLGPCLMGPVLVYPTASQTVNRGSVVTLRASAYACPPTQRYQWILDGMVIPSATSATYQIASAQSTNAGSYQVQVQNTCFGDLYTVDGYAWLTVLDPPVSQTAEVGAQVHLAVRPSGNQPLAYRWIFNGSTMLSGATNSVLELDNVQPLQSGSYAVLVTNAGTVVTSTPAILNVIPLVPRRLVTGIILTAQSNSLLNVEYCSSLLMTQGWEIFPPLYFTNSPQFFFDLTSPLPPQRFYRAHQAGPVGVEPSLEIYMVPALTLTGSVGAKIRVDAINQFGPTDAWFTLETVTLTNTSQPYVDVTAPGRSARLYRLVQVP